MTAHPLRRKNFADLAIGSTLLPLDKGWLIKIPGYQTKTGHAIELEVSNRLLPYIQIYLERVRKRIARPGETGFWVSWDGDKMPYHMVYISFTRITKELFGKVINPHLFRDCAATTLASRSLKAAMAAPGLLGHRRAETTHKYYIHADQLEASRSMNSLLLGLSIPAMGPQKA